MGKCGSPWWSSGRCFCIDVTWSMGDISDSDIGDGRRAVMEQASYICPNSPIEKSLRSSQRSLHTILDRAAQGEAVRIWYSHTPAEICGFYWLLSKMKASTTSGSIYAVKLPEWDTPVKIHFVPIPDGAKSNLDRWDDIFPCSKK